MSQIFCVACPFLVLKAQDSVFEADTLQISSPTDTIEVVEDEVVVEEIVPGPVSADSIEITFPEYEPWEYASIDGKLKMKGLPLSPGVKIRMKKDSIVNISVRAPFIGEAVVIELNPDSLTVVNKMNKTFVREGLNSIGKYYPGGISDIQNLLLARFFLPGHDAETEDLSELTDIYFLDDQIMVVPIGDAKIPGVEYGFVIDEEFEPLYLVVVPEGGGMEVTASYIYKLDGYDLVLALDGGPAPSSMTLELKNPEWKGDIPKEQDLKKFKRLGFQEFMSQIGR